MSNRNEEHKKADREKLIIALTQLVKDLLPEIQTLADVATKGDTVTKGIKGAKIALNYIFFGPKESNADDSIVNRFNRLRHEALKAKDKIAFDAANGMLFNKRKGYDLFVVGDMSLSAIEKNMSRDAIVIQKNSNHQYQVLFFELKKVNNHGEKQLKKHPAHLILEKNTNNNHLEIGVKNKENIKLNEAATTLLDFDTLMPLTMLDGKIPAVSPLITTLVTAGQIMCQTESQQTPMKTHQTQTGVNKSLLLDLLTRHSFWDAILDDVKKLQPEAIADYIVNNELILDTLGLKLTLENKKTMKQFLQEFSAIVLAPLKSEKVNANLLVNFFKQLSEGRYTLLLEALNALIKETDNHSLLIDVIDVLEKEQYRTFFKMLLHKNLLENESIRKILGITPKVTVNLQQNPRAKAEEQAYEDVIAAFLPALLSVIKTLPKDKLHSLIYNVASFIDATENDENTLAIIKDLLALLIDNQVSQKLSDIIAVIVNPSYRPCVQPLLRSMVFNNKDLLRTLGVQEDKAEEFVSLATDLLPSLFTLLSVLDANKSDINIHTLIKAFEYVVQAQDKKLSARTAVSAEEKKRLSHQSTVQQAAAIAQLLKLFQNPQLAEGFIPLCQQLTSTHESLVKNIIKHLIKKEKSGLRQSIKQSSSVSAVLQQTSIEEPSLSFTEALINQFLTTEHQQTIAHILDLMIQPAFGQLIKQYISNELVTLPVGLEPLMANFVDEMHKILQSEQSNAEKSQFLLAVSQGLAKLPPVTHDNTVNPITMLVHRIICVSLEPAIFYKIPKFLAIFNNAQHASFLQKMDTALPLLLKLVAQLPDEQLFGVLAVIHRSTDPDVEKFNRTLYTDIFAPFRAMLLEQPDAVQAILAFAQTPEFNGPIKQFLIDYVVNHPTLVKNFNEVGLIFNDNDRYHVLYNLIPAAAQLYTKDRNLVIEIIDDSLNIAQSQTTEDLTTPLVKKIINAIRKNDVIDKLEPLQNYIDKNKETISYALNKLFAHNPSLTKLANTGDIAVDLITHKKAFPKVLKFIDAYLNGRWWTVFTTGMSLFFNWHTGKKIRQLVWKIITNPSDKPQPASGALPAANPFDDPLPLLSYDSLLVKTPTQPQPEASSLLSEATQSIASTSSQPSPDENVAPGVKNSH